MNCPNCRESVENDAAYCGSCGQALQVNQASNNSSNNLSQPLGQNAAPLAAATAPAPAYTAALPARQNGEQKALISLLLGISGIVGGVFIAIFGLVLGIAGLVTGTVARSTYRRSLSMAGLIASSLAVLTGLGVWIYAVQQDTKTNPQTAPTAKNQPAAPAVLASDLSTPCYSTSFMDELNVSNNEGSCDMNAYNGQSLNTSTDAYKIYANKTQDTSVNDFLVTAKNALEKDIKNNLAGFKIDSQKIGSFAGSPAYIINASDSTKKITVVEAAVMHSVNNGENVFILVHATSGTTEAADLSVLEAEWQWK